MLTLFIGTILIGIGITVPNVLLPGIIKQRFASQLGLFTGIYTISMGISGSISSGLSAPLAYSFGWGWKNSLLIWGLVIIVAILIWLPQLKASQNTSTHLVNDQGTKDTSIWRSLVAWQVTFYMSLQSIVFFIALAWLPSILMSRGLDIAQAGWYLSIMLLCGIPGMFLSSIIANKLPQQKGLSFIIGVIVLIGLFGLFSSSKLILLLATILIGLGNGSGMGLVFTLIGIRTATVSQATALSGMAQSVGYLFSSLGPVMMGLIFDGTGNWNIPIILLICMSLSMLVVGQKAGENKLTHQTNNNPELLMPKHSV
jgi:CP family cyanate transporter-like MFS transporter